MAQRTEETINITANDSTTSLIINARKLRILLDSTLVEQSLPSPKYRRAFLLLKTKEFSKVVRRGNFVRDGQVLQGLTKTLDILFHPSPLNVSTGGSRTGGAVRGIDVDAQLVQLINNGAIPDPVEGFTVNVLRALAAQKLVPFMAQANVGSVDICVGTALDIVCIDMSPRADPINNVVSVQLKTFGSKNHDVARGCFHSLLHECHALTTTRDTLIQRALLQVMCEYAIVQHAHSNALSDARLLVVTSRSIFAPLEDVCKWYRMPPHFPQVTSVFIRSCIQLKTADAEHIDQLKSRQIRLHNKRRNELR